MTGLADTTAFQAANRVQQDLLDIHRKPLQVLSRDLHLGVFEQAALLWLRHIRHLQLGFEIHHRKERNNEMGQYRDSHWYDEDWISDLPSLM